MLALLLSTLVVMSICTLVTRSLSGSRMPALLLSTLVVM